MAQLCAVLCLCPEFSAEGLSFKKPSGNGGRMNIWEILPLQDYLKTNKQNPTPHLHSLYFSTSKTSTLEAGQSAFRTGHWALKTESDLCTCLETYVDTSRLATEYTLKPELTMLPSQNSPILSTPHYHPPSLPLLFFNWNSTRYQLECNVLLAKQPSVSVSGLFLKYTCSI